MHIFFSLFFLVYFSINTIGTPVIAIQIHLYVKGVSRHSLKSNAQIGISLSNKLSIFLCTSF